MSRFVERYDEVHSRVQESRAGMLAASLATAAAFPFAASKVASSNKWQVQKRQDAAKQLAKVGIARPNDEQIDKYLIAKAGRKTPDELRDESFDMDDTRTQRQGKHAMVGSMAGMAVEGGSAAFQALYLKKPGALANLPKDLARGSVIGGLTGGWLGGKSWDKQHEKQEEARKADRIKRKSESADEGDIGEGLIEAVEAGRLDEGIRKAVGHYKSGKEALSKAVSGHQHLTNVAATANKAVTQFGAESDDLWQTMVSHQRNVSLVKNSPASKNTFKNIAGAMDANDARAARYADVAKSAEIEAHNMLTSGIKQHAAEMNAAKAEIKAAAPKIAGVIVGGLAIAGFLAAAASSLKKRGVSQPTPEQINAEAQKLRSDEMQKQHQKGSK